MKLRIALGVGILFIAVLTGLYLYSKNQPRNQAGRVTVPGVLHAGQADFDDYRRHVRIVEAIGEVSTNLNGNMIAVISGSLLNEGDHKLDVIELHVGLFDRNGRKIREDIKTPLQPYLLPHRPLDPVHSLPFSFYVEGISTAWDPRRVDLEIHGLRFTK
ncbi:MAG: hypothetical protein HYR55_17200 [Acidobacteria bacterium]|nr:hypothetical protein [Acidobacteriota bacterium]